MCLKMDDSGYSPAKNCHSTKPGLSELLEGSGRS